MRTIRGRAAVAAVVGLCGAGCEGEENSCWTGGTIDYECGVEGVAGGDAAISGVRSVDAFFASVVRFNETATALTEGIDSELAAIANSVSDQPGDTLEARLTAKLAAIVDGSLEIVAQSAECHVSARAVIDEQAMCDADFERGEASVKCEGSCTAEAGATAECSGDAALTCRGTAPGLDCSGTCTGSCELRAGVECTGTCRGECTGKCTVKDAAGNCAGTCTGGDCKGTCELQAGATCDGACKGTCEYTPPEGTCEVGAEVRCTAATSASVGCKGSCDGKVTPPRASAECTAAATANASVQAECTPPRLTVRFQLEKGVSASAAGEFQGWLTGFEGHVSALLASEARLRGLVAAGADVAASAQAAIGDSINAQIEASDSDSQAEFHRIFGLGCALSEVPKAIALLEESSRELEESSENAASVLGTVGLGS